MKLPLSQILFFFILTLTTCTENATSRLYWGDEFNYPGTPDSTKWSYDLGGEGWGNNELQRYTNDPRNVRVENGNLIIEAHKDSSSYTSARLISKDKGDWLYGRMEVRAKLPKGNGTWPAI